jgi:maltose O-acetyltransferase
MQNGYQKSDRPPFTMFRVCKLYEFANLIPGLSRIFKKIILKRLKTCENVEIRAGFKCLYGKIIAKNASLTDTFFIDYAPITIGENTAFSYENMVITSTHDYLSDSSLDIMVKPVTIGKNCWITSRCIILPGVNIGDNVVIGAGSVVTGDIPSNCFAAGNPCRFIKKIEKEIKWTT